MAANPCFLLVREGGVEPPRRYRHRILNPARLPIPPLSVDAKPLLLVLCVIHHRTNTRCLQVSLVVS